MCNFKHIFINQREKTGLDYKSEPVFYMLIYAKRADFGKKIIVEKK